MDIDLHFIDCNLESIHLRGQSKDIIDIIQQFALLVAVLTRPRSEELCRSESSIFHVGDGNFVIKPGQLESIQVEGICWQPLFAGSVIVPGFPTPERSDQIGLEIPYSIMTALARIWHPIEHDGGLILKGFSTMLVPISDKADAIQWHFISDEVGRRLPTASFKDRIEEWHRFKSLDEIENKRMFVGFCRRVKILLGTREADFASVSYSTNTKRAGRTLELTGGTATTGLAAHGLQGPTVGLTFALSKNQKITRDLVSQDYSGMLEDMKQRSLILYDVDSKKSWLVSTISAVLHMMHIWAQRHPSLVRLRNNQVDLPYAEASWDGGLAAMEAIKNNNLLELHDEPSGEPYRLMDLVKKLWRNIESVIDQMDDAKSGFPRFETQKITAWEMIDVIETPPLCHPKKVRVACTSAGWQHLSGRTMTLFCSGLGDVMTSDSNICPGWSPMPSKMDYMIASASALRLIHDLYWQGDNEQSRLTKRLETLKHIK